MRSATSFFNPALSKSLLRRNWPLIALYALNWFVTLPLPLISRYLDNHAGPIDRFDLWSTVLDTSIGGGIVMTLIFGICFAMAMFSYLSVPRATAGLHALPPRRETLFCTSYLTGLLSMLAVQAVTQLLTFFALAAFGCAGFAPVGQGFLAMVLPTIFFYSFGVLCMIFTGQILAAPVFYGILNVLAVGVDLLVRSFAGNFLYGWSGSSTGEYSVWLSPIVKMLEDVQAETDFTEIVASDGSVSYDLPITGVHVEGMGLLVLYAAVGLVLAALALLVYRTRHSEDTGSVVAIRWARPVFQYGVTICTALALGQLLYELLFGQYRSNGNYSASGTVLCMAIAALIGFFAAEMLLKKSVRVLRSGWRGALIVTAVMALFGLSMTFDLTGYEGYQPRTADIEEAVAAIYSSGSSAVFDAKTPEQIEQLLAAHRSVIADKARQQRFDGGYESTDRGQISLFVTYMLRGGRTVERNYPVLVLDKSAFQDPDSPESRIDALYNQEEAVRSRVYGLSHDQAFLNNPSFRVTGGYCSFLTADSVTSAESDLSREQAVELQSAIERDLAAGRGRASLFDDVRPTFDDNGYYIELYVMIVDEKGNPVSTSCTLNPTADMSETLTAIRHLREATLFGGSNPG